MIGFAGIYWLVSARKWFKGPKVMGTPEELKAIERELEAGLEERIERTSAAGQTAAALVPSPRRA